MEAATPLEVARRGGPLSIAWTGRRRRRRPWPRPSRWPGARCRRRSPGRGSGGGDGGPGRAPRGGAARGAAVHHLDGAAAAVETEAAPLEVTDTHLLNGAASAEETISRPSRWRGRPGRSGASPGGNG